MEYKGKLYGHLGGNMYFDTGKTADDLDALEKKVSELEAKKQQLNIGAVSRSAFLMHIRWFEKMFCKHKNKTEIFRCYQDRYVSEVCNDCCKFIYSDL